MRVLERSNFLGVFPMRIKCRRVADKYGFSYGVDVDFCGSILEIDAADIKKHHWVKYPDYSGTDYGVVCPVCGKFIVINKNEIPESVIYRAEEISLNA